MKKRILILANTLNVGGVEKSLVSFLQSMDYDYYHIDLVLISSGVFSQYIPREVNIIEPPEYYKWIFLPKRDLPRALFASLGANLNSLRFVFYILKGLAIRNMGKARQQLMKSCMHTLPPFTSAYDVAIDYTGVFKSLLVNKTTASKKISWVHSDYRVYKRDKELDNEDYAKVDAIVTVSETCNKIFSLEFPHYKDKCFVIPNISNKQQIIKMSLENVGLDDDYTGIKILDVTRLDPNKGIDLAIKACKLLVDKGYDIRWYILGEGPERTRLESLISQADLENKFILLGSRPNPYPYMKDADVIVHCSLFEGRAVAIDEAMLLGKPIILTNYPTAKDQITDGVNGIICEISIDGVYNALKYLLDNRSKRDELSRNLTNYDIPPDISLNVFYELIGNN